MPIKEITIDKIETIPLGNNDLIEEVVRLAARVELLERRITNMENWHRVPANKQGHHNPTETS